MKTALGISIGDTIKTSYVSTGTVRSIWGPFWWWTPLDDRDLGFYHVTIWPYPVISVGLGGAGGINDIHQDGERWFTDMGDEIFITKGSKKDFQMDLFAGMVIETDDPRTRPYVFDPEVDYSDAKHVFQCWKTKCKRDFNGEKWNGGRANPHCPYCGAWTSRSVIVMPAVVPGERYVSNYVRALNA